MGFKIKTIRYIIQDIFRPRWRDRLQLEAFQQRMISKHLRFLKQESPYFKSLDKSFLQELPLMNKQLMMQHFDLLNTKGLRKEDVIALALQSEVSRDFSAEINGITVGLSSGTSGNRGVFVVSEKERARYAAAIFHKVLRPLKLRKTRAALFFRSNSKLYESVRSVFLEFNFFDLTLDLGSQIARLEKFNPHLLVSPPALLRILAEKKRNGSLKCSPEKIIAVAEVLEDDVKELVEKAFGIVLHQLYQCTEGFLASTCESGNLHLHEEFLHVEKKWIDSERTRYHPVITDFTRSTQPIVRYELNDILLEGTACTCGRVQATIKKIEGRSDDIFCLENTTGESIPVFPDQIRNAVIRSSDRIREYQVEQTSAKAISVFLETDAADFISAGGLLCRSLEELLSEKNIRGVAITIENVRDQDHRVKYRRVINSSNKKYHGV
jgi:putative adenylate-forming enzyme